MLTEHERNTLLSIAAQSIRTGLESGHPAVTHVEQQPSALQQIAASFVTLHRHSELRGCIGSLEGHQPLVQNVAENAYNAAFRDPRFAPLQAQELDDLDVEISVLSPPQPLAFSSEQDLVEQLQPGKDGLILEAAGHRGTFLPSVWESLPTPTQFLNHLKQKAGLPLDYWSDEVTIQRYGTEAFGKPFAQISLG